MCLPMRTALAPSSNAVAPGDLVVGSGPPKIFGILNITEDSFSDGGVHLDPGAAVAASRQLAVDGADVAVTARSGSATVNAPVKDCVIGLAAKSATLEAIVRV